MTTEETFDYDNLDRLLSAEVKTTGGSTPYDVTESYGYDDLGNLISKGGKTYSYTGCGGRPHAVCSVNGGPVFGYDGNGNMTSGADRMVVYNARNKVGFVKRQPAMSSGNDAGTVNFLYGADGNRVVQDVANADGTVERTVYVGMGDTGKSLYERTTRGTSGVVEHRHFLYGGGDHGGGAFAIRVVTKVSGTSTTATKYQLFDHLASVTAQADEAGKVVDAGTGGPNATVLGYDAWGARRNPDGTAANPSTFSLQTGHREFTGHETIPDVGLVNMNGRVYDPVIGRFLSPDPNVQNATDTQSYNRYSYVLNNPLRYADPTGYFTLDNNPLAFLSAPGFVECNDQCKLQVGITVVVTVGCIASDGAACPALIAGGAAMNTAAMASNGVPWDQALAFGILSFEVGIASGGIANGLTSSFINAAAYPVAAQAISGAVAATISSASMQLITGGSVNGWDVLEAALGGAAMAATTTSIQRSVALSRASAASAQGGGEGRGDEVGSYDEAEYRRLMAQLRRDRAVGSDGVLLASAADGAEGHSGSLKDDVPAEGNSSSSSSPGRRNTPDQDALIQIAKDARNTGGVTVDEAKTIKDWGKETGVPVRGPEVHPDRPYGKEPHIHVGPVDHIPVLPMMPLTPPVFPTLPSFPIFEPIFIL